MLNYSHYSLANINVQNDFKLLDVIKLVAAFCVVYMHTSPLSEIQPHINFFIINGLGRIVVPFFFMCSGFFFFRKKNSNSFFYKYIKRLLVLLFFWLTVYHVFYWIFLKQTLTIQQYLLSYFYNSSPLWYLEALIKGTTVLFILSRFVRWREITLFFFCVTFLLYSPMNFYVHELTPLKNLYSNFIIPLKVLRIDSFFFIALGAYFANCDVSRLYNGKSLNLIVVLLFMLLLMEASLFKYLTIRSGDVRNPQHYFVLPFLLFFFFYRIITIQYSGAINTINCRKYSSIIYFSHQAFKICIVYFLTNTFEVKNNLILFILLSTVCILFAFSIVKLESTSIGKYLKFIY